MKKADLDGLMQTNPGYQLENELLGSQEIIKTVQ